MKLISENASHKFTCFLTGSDPGRGPLLSPPGCIGGRNVTVEEDAAAGVVLNGGAGGLIAVFYTSEEGARREGASECQECPLLPHL